MAILDSGKRICLLRTKVSRPGLSRFRRRRLVPTCLMKTFRLSEIPEVPNRQQPHEEAGKGEEDLPAVATRTPSRFSHSSVDPINIVSRGMSSVVAAVFSIRRYRVIVRRPKRPLSNCFLELPGLPTFS